MMRRTWLGAFLLLVAGCGSSSHSLRGLDEMERVRTTPGAREGAELAPQAFAQAEEERARARAAQGAGDEAGAELYAARATAGYQRALVLARLAKAEKELRDAQAALDSAGEQARDLARQRAGVEADAESLDKQLLVAREQLLPAPSGKADPARESARRVAARSLVTQGQLLCGAARLLSPSLTDTEQVEQAVATVQKQLESGKGPAPIDAAARARAGCLALLTKARRMADKDAGADALLAELSASGGWDPARDERGVVMTLRNAFHASGLTSEAERRLKELGRVAGAHPGVAVQVVVHDALTPSAVEARADAQRAEAAVSALVSAGAPAEKVKGEMAGAHAPIVDPADAKHRARNARLEVVFVVPGG